MLIKKLPVKKFLILLFLLSSRASLFAQEAPGTYGVALDHLILETTNIDSISTHFRRAGFEVHNDGRNVKPVDTLVLDHRTRVEIRHFSPYDTSDAPFNSLANYYSAVVFRAQQLPTIEALLEHDTVGRTESSQMANVFTLERDTSGTKALALAGAGPFDIIFVEGEVSQRDPDAIDRNHIDWLIFTAGEHVQKRLARMFDLLKFTKKHEGCCDYWLIGPPGERMKIRFDFDHQTANPESLSIEPGGVIFAR